MDASELKKSLSYRDILILAFGTIIGWGWVVLTGSWVVAGGGIGAALAFAAGGLLCILVGMAYCELTPSLPYAGGELVFSYRAMGYNASFFTGWMITFAYIGVAAWEGPALATAIDYIFPIPRFGYLWTVAGFDVYLSWLLIPALMGIFLTFINLRGIKISSIFQTVVTSLLALGGIAFVIVGLLKGNIDNATPLITNQTGVFSVFLAVPALYVGFDVIPQAAEEMNVPLKKIPRAIILSICLAAAWYIAMILSAFYMAPSNILGEEGISVANAIVYATHSQLVGKLMIVSAIMGILTSWNGFIIGATRVLYAMGRSKMIPSFLGKIHPKYRTPYASIIFIGIITILTPLLGQNALGWFVDASAFGTVLAYFMVALSFLVLRFKEPNLVRPYYVKNGLLVGLIAIIIAGFFITLYLPFGSSSLNQVEWLIVLVWMSLGIIFYLSCFKYIKSNKEDREKVLYGNK